MIEITVYLYHSVVTVRFNTTEVRDDESAGSLTFILVTNIPANTRFTVQVSTEDPDPSPNFGTATGNLIIYYGKTIHIINVSLLMTTIAT